MENGVRRWLVKILEWNPSDDQFLYFLSFLPIHEHSAITRFVKFEDRKRALVSRLLQYSLVHEVLGIPFDNIIINRTVEGKPYLQNGKNVVFPNFNFNSSHHGDYVGIASEPMCLVGLDIISNTSNTHEPALEFLKNFSSYFTASEWREIKCAGDSDEILATFYRYWCLKEAFVKAIGSGLGFGLERLEFHHTNWTNISVHIDGVESRFWSFQLFELDEGHWAAVARGHPKDVVDSHKSTINMENTTEEHSDCFLLPDINDFNLRTVEQLIPVSDSDRKRGILPSNER